MFFYRGNIYLAIALTYLPKRAARFERFASAENALNLFYLTARREKFLEQNTSSRSAAVIGSYQMSISTIYWLLTYYCSLFW